MKIKRRSCPLSLHHPHRFLQCSFRFVCVILCYTSLLVVSASLSSPCLFPTPHPDSLFYDFMLMARHYFLGIITFSLLYSPHYSCPVLLFPRFILCPILTSFAAEYCFSFFIGPGPLSFHPQQQACFFITPRPKVGATHWSLCWWEQNVMDFHLHSQMWLQRCIRVFIRRGQEVIHHGTTWEHLTVL